MDIKDTKEIESTEFNKWFGMGTSGRGQINQAGCPAVRLRELGWNFNYSRDGGGCSGKNEN